METAKIESSGYSISAVFVADADNRAILYFALFVFETIPV